MSITTQDIASTTTLGQSGQLIITGTPTAGSTQVFGPYSSDNRQGTGFSVMVSGTWTGTLQFEASMDNGTTWFPYNLVIPAVGQTIMQITANCIAKGNLNEITHFRVRAVAAITGTANVILTATYGDDVLHAIVSQKGHTIALQSQATTNGNGTVANVGGKDGAFCLEIDNGAGTCNVTLQGSFDNFATAQSAQVVGLIQVSTNAAGTPTGTTSRGLSTTVSVASNTSYSLQVNDIYPFYRAVISSASGLGAGTAFTGCTANLYANPM